jgi:hypothetical protein
MIAARLAMCLLSVAWVLCGAQLNVLGASMTSSPPSALVVGAVLESISALNWRPHSRSWTQQPWAVSHSPGLTDGKAVYINNIYKSASILGRMM